MMAILEAMLCNQMIVVSAGRTFGFGASATTGPGSPGITKRNRQPPANLAFSDGNKRGLAQSQ
jgi:hypothetical protein